MPREPGGLNVRIVVDYYCTVCGRCMMDPVPDHGVVMLERDRKTDRDEMGTKGHLTLVLSCFVHRN